jgi:hypothetical protein
MNHERTTLGSNGNGNGEDALMRAVGRLPQSIEPARDLWPAIESRLDEPVRAGRPRVQLTWSYALAAAVGCVTLGALLSYALLRKDATTAIPTQVAAAPSNRPTVQQASFGSYAALGPEYESARAALVIDLAERLHRLPPLARIKVERNLDEIQRAVREINAALELSPDDPLLQDLLMDTYQDELRLLAHVNQIAGDIPART